MPQLSEINPITSPVEPSVWAIVAWLLIAILLSLFVFTRMRRDKWQANINDSWVIFGGISVLWWMLAGQFSLVGSISVVTSSFVGFAIGAIVGFIFTSYGEDESSIGKIREWLLGGIVGLTLAEVARGGANISAFVRMYAPSTQPATYGVHVAMLIVYSILGFFTLFFLRETVWNIAFEEGRGKRRRLQQFFKDAKADPSEPGKAPTVDRDLIPALVKALNTWEANPDWSREGVRNYAQGLYAVHEYDKAIDVLKQGLSRYPDDPDLLLLIGDILITAGRETEAVPYLERLIAMPNAPARAWKLLGYALLFFYKRELRLKQSIAMTKKYLELVPNNPWAEFNLACAYAQFGPADPDNRTQMELWLDRAIQHNSGFRDRVRGIITEDFAEYENDPDFAAKYLNPLPPNG